MNSLRLEIEKLSPDRIAQIRQWVGHLRAVYAHELTDDQLDAVIRWFDEAADAHLEQAKALNKLAAVRA